MHMIGSASKPDWSLWHSSRLVCTCLAALPGMCRRQRVRRAAHQAHLLSICKHPAATHLPATVNEVLKSCQHHVGPSRLNIAAHDDFSPDVFL